MEVAVRSSTGLTTLDPKSVKITTTSKVLGAAGDVVELLEKAGIEVDGESLGLVYDLNPDKNIARLPSGSVVNIPVVGTGQASNVPNGRVRLTRDTSVKQSLSRTAIALKDQLPKLKQIGLKANGKKFRELAETVIDQLELVRLAIAGRRSVLDGHSLQQMALEAEALASTIRDVSRRPIAKPDIDWLTVLADDMNVRMLSFKEDKSSGDLPGPIHKATVRVRTLRFVQANGASTKIEVAGLRVYYTSEALYSRGSGVREFAKLTSPSEQQLPEANYRLWVGTQPQDSSTVRVQVRAHDNEIIDVDIIAP
jgi:hypothetical protein